jgi:hypothetical protein
MQDNDKAAMRLNHPPLRADEMHRYLAAIPLLQQAVFAFLPENAEMSVDCTNGLGSLIVTIPFTLLLSVSVQKHLPCLQIWQHRCHSSFFFFFAVGFELKALLYHLSHAPLPALLLSYFSECCIFAQAGPGLNSSCLCFLCSCNDRCMLLNLPVLVKMVSH